MFSNTTEYALRAMACLALTPTELVSSAELARQTKVPKHYLLKVLQELIAANLIEGRRGAGGGFRLRRPASDIAILDVLNAIQPIRRIQTCPLGLSTHGANLCPLHQHMDRAAADIISTFGAVTLQQLLDTPGKPTPLCERRQNVPLTVSAERQ